MPVSQVNRRNAEIAKERYLESTDSAGEAADWITAINEARLVADGALLASNDLRNIGNAIAESGRHMMAFRHLLAPPKSQDQFKLLCPSWPKGTEKSGAGLRMEVANAAAIVIERWLDRTITPWLSTNQPPTAAERSIVIERIVSFIAPKVTDTAKRNRLSTAQEQAVVQLLLGNGWTRLPSVEIDNRGIVPARHFMHKTRFATATTSAQEVDIACGLNGSIVAAMECKVTNDETNSVKRVNDVLKKAAAWKTHYGNFVQTAALLQGVIKPSDVQRLTDEGVHVFWSHDLDAFSEWIEDRA
jgi:XamI restriction endonuclease